MLKTSAVIWYFFNLAIKLRCNITISSFLSYCNSDADQFPQNAAEIARKKEQNLNPKKSG